MGFLKVFGRPLHWDESKEFHKIIKKDALEKIISWIEKTIDLKCYPKFGYEFEFHKIQIDDNEKKVYIDLSGNNDIKDFEYKGQDYILQHEYGKWMIEIIPNKPFEFNEIPNIEKSIRNMYKFLEKDIGKHKILSMSPFPILGVGNYFKDFEFNETDEDVIKMFSDVKTNPFSESIFTSDCIINPHPRFGTLTRNIRLRRGEKVCIKVPIYNDVNTNIEVNESEPFPGYIYGDSMAFGMGNCCFQMTIGSCSLNNSCYLYDQFIPFTPILIALTASSPIFKGKLSGYDSRYSILSQSVDDRTEEERNPLSNKFILKSRSSTAYSYISEYVQDYHNDYRQFPINEEFEKEMIDRKIPPRLSRHIANLLVRDPLVIFEKKIYIEDEKDRSHFEGFNSTNWNSLRFRPPRMEDNDSCFKIEVRPSDLQLTAFENAAIMTFTILYSRILFRYKANFIIPISMVDENFEKAYLNDAYEKEKFWFKINSIPEDWKDVILDKPCPFIPKTDEIPIKEDELKNIKQLTIEEILCGKDNYPGILLLMYKYIEEYYTEEEDIKKLYSHLRFIEKRAKGKIWTDAKYIRNFVLNHPEYNNDSIVSEIINYDLIKTLVRITSEELSPKELFDI